MYNKKNIICPMRKSRKNGRLLGMILLALFLTLCVFVGGTLAYLAAETGAVVNTFKPSSVTCEVKEKFENNIKTDVNVKNTGDIDAYVRVKLVSYRVNAQGKPIGGEAELPEFTLGDGWFESGDHYYYKYAVAPSQIPTEPLIGTPGISLQNYNYTFYTEAEAEADPTHEEGDIKSGLMGGGYQAIDVIAEAIQAEGIDSETKSPAVTEAWGVRVNPDGTLSAN